MTEEGNMAELLGCVDLSVYQAGFQQSSPCTGMTIW